MKIEYMINLLTEIQKKHPNIDVECCLNNENTGVPEDIVYVESYNFRYASRGCPTCLINFSE